MNSTTIARPEPSVITSPAARRFGQYALFAAVYTYLLVVFGGLVRITNSGLGCGDEWPKCNGRWIPQFTFETMIEYVHRLLGVTIGLVLLALAWYAFRHRNEPGFRERMGHNWTAYTAVSIVVVQGLLGAVTVWLDLPTAVVVVHFMTALLLLAILLRAAVQAGVIGGPAADFPAAGLQRHARAATAATGLAFVVITFGALTANTPGAPMACLGFPLCNGTFLPAANSPTYLHWIHRLLAFGLMLHVLSVAMRAQSLPPALRSGALAASMLIALQIGVAAVLVALGLPRQLQVLHLAVGAAAWAVVVSWMFVARRAAARAAL